MKIIKIKEIQDLPNFSWHFVEKSLTNNIILYLNIA